MKVTVVGVCDDGIIRRSIHASMKRSLFLIVLLFGISQSAIFTSLCVAASSPANFSAKPDEQALAVTASFGERESVRSDERIELLLSRALKESEGRLAVLIGTTDVTSLFTRDKLRLLYNAKLWPLPLGESQVTVYLVSKDDDWKEIAHFVLKVSNERTSSDNDVSATFLKARFSLPSFAPMLAKSLNEEQATTGQQAPPKPAANHKGKIKFTPSLTLTINSQPTQSTFPGPQPERATFTELNLQASLKNDMEVGILKAQSSFDFAGASFQQATLRFGTLGKDAPKVDLSSYLIHFQTGKIKYDVGHFSYGAQRQLINGFSSRGISITVPFLKRFDFSAAAMNGTQLVGYDNFFGLSKTKHQMLSGTVGFEFFPKRPGGVRVEVGVLSAYFQPISGANRGVVTDLQRSRGVSVRLIASDQGGRFHFEGGFTRSFFASPSDTTLNQGTNVVALPNLTRNAHYLEASYNILRNHSLTKTKKANLSVAFREENVAPLFRSLGASTQADKIQYEVSVNGSVDEITGQFSHSNFHDNLRNIPSILRTLNGSTHISLAAPTSALLFWLGPDAKKSAWLPRLGYSFDRNHSFGAAIPVNGGFEVDLSTIPNQFGTNQTFSADWQIKKYTIGYSLNHSLQDNQQRGREKADSGVFVNTGRFGIPLSSKLSLNLDLSAESSANKETGRIDRNYRAGPGISWAVTKHFSVNGSLANVIAGDRAHTNHSRNTDFDAALTYRFGMGEGLKKVSGQCFLRYANHYSFARDNVFATNSLRKNQTLTLNVGFTFF
jgi:hypothetical protein